MENAARALLIAGAVLIAILLLSLFAYIVREIGASTARIDDSMQETRINKHNQQFLNFDGKGYDKVVVKTTETSTSEEVVYLNIQDVVTLVNLARSSNEEGKFPQRVTVTLDGTNITNKTTEEIFSEISDGEYKCRITVNPSTKLVDTVVINRK